MSEDGKSPKFLGIKSPKLPFHSPKVTADSPKVQPEDNKFYSTGRGGAGNIGFGSPDLSPQLVPEEQVIHPLNQKVFTTGRGGAGNMRSNDDPELTRKIQDEVKPAPEVDPEAPTMGAISIGRGGFGNVKATQRAETEQKKSILDRMKDALKK